jgi:hypothetical protein
MADMDPAEVERRLRAGEWLGTTALAALFQRDRTTIYRWGKRGVLVAKEDPVSRDLSFAPTSALELLARFRSHPPQGDGAD